MASRTQIEFAKNLLTVLVECGVPSDNMPKLLDSLSSLLTPLPEPGSPQEILAAGLAKINEYLATLAPGAELESTSSMMLNSGLDPKNSSDRRAVNKLLKTTDAMAYVPAVKGHYVRRLNGNGADNGNKRR